MPSAKGLPMRSKNVSKLSAVRSFADPEEAGAAGFDLIDEGEILVAFGIGDLVDADGVDRPQRAVGQAPFDHILHRVADFIPAGAE